MKQMFCSWSYLIIWINSSSLLRIPAPLIHRTLLEALDHLWASMRSKIFKHVKSLKKFGWRSTSVLFTLVNNSLGIHWASVLYMFYVCTGPSVPIRAHPCPSVAVLAYPFTLELLARAMCKHLTDATNASLMLGDWLSASISRMPIFHVQGH